LKGTQDSLDSAEILVVSGDDVIHKYRDDVDYILNLSPTRSAMQRCLTRNYIPLA
jgi:hypothetical protein